MPVQAKTEVTVRCFCGNRLAVNLRARKEIICDRCHQPVPMKAIRAASERGTERGMQSPGSAGRQVAVGA